MSVDLYKVHDTMIEETYLLNIEPSQANAYGNSSG